MEPQDRNDNDDPQATNSPPRGERTGQKRSPGGGPMVVGTDDPQIMPGPTVDPDWIEHPDQSMSIETSRIRGPSDAYNPTLVVVPIEVPARSGRGEAAKNGGPKNEGRKNNGDNGKKPHDDPGAKKGDDEEKDDDDGDHRAKKKGNQPAQQPISLTRMLLYAGAVALVCGMLGAWGYSAVFGSSKSSDQKSSGKDSKSGKDSGSGKDSESGKDSDSDKDSESSRKEGEKLAQAEAAWMDAVKELRQARTAASDARNSEEETKAILDFLKKNLLASGRVPDNALAQAFWAGGPGKDMTLRQAVDSADAQVAGAFAERPTAEAGIREILGLAYLNLGDPKQASKEYARALELRQAIQGRGDPDTAACRNQLAVAERLAGRAAQAGRLYDQPAGTADQASALAIRGKTLLLENKPADAELKLRECLTILDKSRPDDWQTFDARSLLGEALLDQKRFVEAEQQLVAGYEGLKNHAAAIPPEEKPHVREALVRLVKLYEVWGKNDEVLKWRQELK